MIKAIETRYKGYRFRSRHEARWAVLFDALDIKWEYELEGYELSPYAFNLEEWIKKHRDEEVPTDILRKLGEMVGECASKTIHYLPDFWLPGFNAFAEVKPEGKMLSLVDVDKLSRLGYLTQHPCMFCTDLTDYPKGFVSAEIRQGILEMERAVFHFGVNQIEWKEACEAARSSRFEHGESGSSKKKPKAKRRISLKETLGIA